MNTDFPTPITSFADLKTYENYLQEEFCDKSPTFKNLFNTLLESVIKIDCTVGNRLEAKIGKLKEIGDDYVLLTLQNGKNMIIGLESIKFVTILQNNIKYPHF